MNNGIDKRNIDIDELILNMFRGISHSLSEDEFNLVGLKKRNFLKRREFSNIYKTLMLFLMRKSIPESFPSKSKAILQRFGSFYEMAYQNKNKLKTLIDADLRTFEELCPLESKEGQFDRLALFIAEKFERGPKKLIYAACLAVRIDELFKDFVKVERMYEIIDP